MGYKMIGSEIPVPTVVEDVEPETEEEVDEPITSSSAVNRLTLENTRQVTRSLLLNTYSQSLQSINVGFSLAAALAWNEVVKHYLEMNLKDIKKTNYYHVMYATIVTFLTATVFLITKTFLDRNFKKSSVTPIIGMR